MPKYNVTIGFDLSTEIEPEIGRYAFDRDGVEDWEDSTYWSTDPITASGGEVCFTVEAESEEVAEEKAHEIVYDGMEVNDDNSISWGVENISVEVEAVEVPMDVVRASELVTKFLAEYPSMNPELKEAILFLLKLITERTPDGEQPQNRPH